MQGLTSSKSAIFFFDGKNISVEFAKKLSLFFNIFSVIFFFSFLFLLFSVIFYSCWKWKFSTGLRWHAESKKHFFKQYLNSDFEIAALNVSKIFSVYLSFYVSVLIIICVFFRLFPCVFSIVMCVWFFLFSVCLWFLLFGFLCV